MTTLHRQTTLPSSTAEGAGIRSAHLAAGIIALFIGLGICYSLIVPPFETPDEIFHYAFVRHLAAGGGLPVQTGDQLGPWAHEGTQAPLYYIVAGRLTSWIDQSDFDSLAIPNPHANLGNPLYPGNKNYGLYSAAPRPLAGANLALHVARWLSILLMAGALAFLYGTARLAIGERRALWALLIAAAVPQFAFVGASCSNDSMAIFLSAGALYWLARLIARPIERPIRMWEWWALGALLGAAALSKLHSLGLLGLFGLALAWLAWRRRAPRMIAVALIGVLLPAAAIAGWWYWRNHTLYGEWLGIQQLLTINGLRTETRTWRGFIGEMRGLRYSFWGLFGWFNIIFPVWVYRVLDAVALAAGGGLVLRIVNGLRGRLRPMQSNGAPVSPPIVGLLALWLAMLVGLMIYWSSFGTSSQGRLLFPAMPSVAVLLVVGLTAWTDVAAPAVAARLNKGRHVEPAGLAPLLLAPLCAGLLACSVFALTVLFPAAYGPLRPIASLPAKAAPVGDRVMLDGGGEIEIVGVELPERRYGLGEFVPVTLYVRAPQPIPADYRVFVQLLDAQGRVMGNVTTHPGWGRFPTSLWRPGELYADLYQVQIREYASTRSPLVARIYAGFTEGNASLDPLDAVTGDGRPASGILGTVQVAARARLDAVALGLTPAEARFGEDMRLLAQAQDPPLNLATAGQAISVTLLWEAAAAPGIEYSAFVHLLGPDGRQVAGVDGPPGEGRLSTAGWRPGDRSVSTFELVLPAGLPPGLYRLVTGLYETASQGHTRLPASSESLRVEHLAVQLGTLEVP